MTAYRLRSGGAVDRKRPITFIVDGRTYSGLDGDTLASGLLASGVWLMGRSFKRHRPRGVMSAGVEEANALFTVGVGGRSEPNTQATRVDLYDGLVARSQNHWPSLAFDTGALLDVAAPLFPAGFYYKTFKWPARAWPLYESVIRRLAGLGPAPRDADPDDYAERDAHADVLVVGLGLAGIAAACTAAAAGLRVIALEQNAEAGIALADVRIDGATAPRALAQMVRDLQSAGVRVLFRTTAFGMYDHGLVGAVERLAQPGRFAEVAQRLWRIQARTIVLATGAIERPIAFTNNDRPGVMLASSAALYATQYGVAVGAAPVVVTCGDHGYRSALALVQAGVSVAAILDLRPREAIPEAAVAAAATCGVTLFPNVTALRTHGVARVTGLSFISGGRPVRLACDATLVSGGWTPAVHLHAQARTPLASNSAWRAVIPAASQGPVQSAGICAGADGALEAWLDGQRAGRRAALACGRNAPQYRPPEIDEPPLGACGGALPVMASFDAKRTFIDLQNDVTAADIALAAREGYGAPEHTKRYTTLGMGADQGKTSGVLGLHLIAAAQDADAATLAPTTYRPPFTPVTLGALAGGRTGANLTPTRRSLLHSLFEAAGASFQTSGAWLRPRNFPLPGETRTASTDREARMVRGRVGVTDASTLGKIWVEGPDAATLLDSVYASAIGSCPIGRARYAFLLNDDGGVHDDGVVQRWGTDAFLVTTSTVRLADVLARIEFFRDVVLRGLDADVVDLTEAWSGVIVAGPQSAAAIAAVLGDARLPAPQGLLQTVWRGEPLRIARISYSGERAYELYTPPDLVASLWGAVLAQALDRGGGPYGLDALDWLRVEKGHIAVGAEIDGRATARDLGLGRWMKKGLDFAGALGASRPAFLEPGRLELVGLRTVSGSAREGGVLIDVSGAACGHVTSTGFGVGLETPVALAVLRNGRSRWGERLAVAAPTRRAGADVIVDAPCRFDPSGARCLGD